jgi:hypothetical protein
MRTVRIKHQSITEISTYEIEDIGTLDSEPYHVLRAKTQQVIDLLDCDEATAERIVLQRLDAQLFGE